MAWPPIIWGEGLRRGPSEGRRIALTFDDGPAEMTPQFLETLARFDVPATFFVCGCNVERLPRTAKEIAKAGHELGNHTYRHRSLLRLGRRGVMNEVARAQSAIEDATGVSPRHFRPPYGIPSPWLPAALRQRGLRNVLWTVIGGDWKYPAKRIARKVLKRAKPGSIVCLHDGCDVSPAADREETLRALETILPRLRAEGFEFVRIADMDQPQ